MRRSAMVARASYAFCYRGSVAGITRDEVFALLGRALRELRPDVAEERLRDLERAAAADAVVEPVRGTRADDIGIAMNAIERATPGGPRGLWTVVAERGRVDAFTVTVRVEESSESRVRKLDEVLVPALQQLVPPEVKEGLATASPGLEAILDLARRALPDRSLADLASGLHERLRNPHPVKALPDAAAALREAFPERAEEILAGLRRLIPHFAPALERAQQSRPTGENGEGLPLAEAAAAAATRVEDGQKGGARFRWTARARGAALEMLREPL